MFDHNRIPARTADRGSDPVREARRQVAARAVLGLTLASLALLVTVAASAQAVAPSPGLKQGISKVKGGETVVTYDASVGSLLASLGITPSPVAPATSPTGNSFRFPIVAGRVNYQKTRNGKVTKRNINGWLDHSGGISLSRVTPATTVTLSNLRINLGAHKDGNVSARVNGGGRLAVYSLSSVTVDSSDRSISATLKLTADGAKALNRAFGVTAWAAGATVGTVKSTPTF